MNGYFLEWHAEQSVQHVHLREAYEVVDQVIKVAQVHEVAVVLDGDLVIFESATDKCWFGYPPRSFLDELTPRERTAVVEVGASRDGYLSIHGTGAGVIQTNRGWVDLPVRLFLSVLANKAHLEISDSDDAEYGTRGIRVGPGHEKFAWYPRWPEIKSAVKTVWFVDGENTVVLNGDSVYNW